MDGVSGRSTTEADPEGLLRSALEKIVFFECRVSQLESELASAQDATGRARGETARAERRALQLEQALASEKGARADAERRASELHERVRLLEAERERLLGGLVERARLSGAAGSSGEPGPEEGGADLAGFIAELRAEIEALRAGAPGATLPPARNAPAATVAELARSFERTGRVGLTSRDTGRLRDVLATRADRALYERSLDDLGAPDPGRRVRAVRALEALGSRAAAPILAGALGREEHPDVKVALLGALARFREPFAADLAGRQLADARPVVRVAALETLAAVAAEAAEEKLAAALSDESPLVRRRAALLLGLRAGPRADEALAVALADADRGVARAAAVALSGRPTARAQEALARGLEHPDASVRQAAGEALSRVSGEAVDADAPPSVRRAASRRIAERLAGMQGDEIRAAVLRSADAAKATAERVLAATARPEPSRVTAGTPLLHVAEGQGEGALSAPSPARTAVAVLAAPDEGAAPDALEPRIVAEIRAALRGCTPEGLASVLGAPAPRVEAALQSLLASGTIAQRGTRWFMS
jgi:HEAT repeat protein